MTAGVEKERRLFLWKALAKPFFLLSHFYKLPIY
jgi:hypothetical protein